MHRLPAHAPTDHSAWDQALYAFLVEKGNRSGSQRTVQSYAGMLWPFFGSAGKPPDQITPGDVLAWAHGIGLSGRPPSAPTIGARIACLSADSTPIRTPVPRRSVQPFHGFSDTPR